MNSPSPADIHAALGRHCGKTVRVGRFGLLGGYLHIEKPIPGSYNVWWTSGKTSHNARCGPALCVTYTAGEPCGWWFSVLSMHRATSLEQQEFISKRMLKRMKKAGFFKQRKS